jgi:hypothetical protein
MFCSLMFFSLCLFLMILSVGGSARFGKYPISGVLGHAVEGLSMVVLVYIIGWYDKWCVFCRTAGSKKLINLLMQANILQFQFGLLDNSFDHDDRGPSTRFHLYGLEFGSSFAPPPDDVH